MLNSMPSKCQKRKEFQVSRDFNFYLLYHWGGKGTSDKVVWAAEYVRMNKSVMDILWFFQATYCLGKKYKVSQGYRYIYDSNNGEKN